MKKILALILAFTFCLAILCSCGEEETKETYGVAFTAGINIDPTGHTLHDVEITVKNYGIITLKLDETIAPITVKNFIKLANEGFYDGLTFHRIIDGFMIQGGDPKGNGQGGSKETIKGEFYYNGVDNPLSHVRGVISMARQGENPYYGITAEMANNSASSQFFIMHKDNIRLNGQYAAFGWVTSGMEFVDQICADTKVEDGNGTVLAKNQPVIKSVRVVKSYPGTQIENTETKPTYRVEEGKETLGEVFSPSINIDTTGHKLHLVNITVKNYGIITLELDETLAPITVNNFIKLANEGFYDGLTFHRIISGFMIQGGDPKGNGTGGSDENIKGEFSYNGVENDLSHVRGVISMARQGENPYYGITAEMANNSATSQFFIMHKNNSGLDGQYAAFGWVVQGMEFVDQICEDTKVEDGNGTVLAQNQPVITSVVVLPAPEES